MKIKKYNAITKCMAEVVLSYGQDGQNGSKSGGLTRPLKS